tara:strand:- start:226 stop:399 length:174 start_codon:yes stop_codon:yes gene_type:complete
MQMHSADAKRLAIEEILQGKNECAIRRYLPNGNHEDVDIASLRIHEDMKRYQLNPEK